MDLEEYREKAKDLQSRRERNSELLCVSKKIFRNAEEFGEESSRWLDATSENVLGCTRSKQCHEELLSENKIFRDACYDCFENERSKINRELFDLEEEQSLLNDEWKREKMIEEEKNNG